MQNREHWRKVFETRASSEVSWYQPHLATSLELIAKTGVTPDNRIIDVGGGDSTLVDDLIQRGFTNLTVLDIASSAMDRARQRLGDAGSRIEWKEGDIARTSLPEHQYDLWHDRAVFHFLVDEGARREYVSRASNAIKPGGHLIIATFASDGPERCSGLPTMRYSPEALAREFRQEFTLVESRNETHKTPAGKEQKFVYCWFRRNLT